MSIELQPYQASDKKYLWNTYTKAMKPHIDKMWGWDNSWQKNNFEQSLIEYQTSILKVTNGAIGYLQVKYDTENTFISMLILEPNQQSKGLGAKILEKVQSIHPGKPIKLRCFQANKSAYNFYIRSGFKVEDTDEYFISMIRHA